MVVAGGMHGGMGMHDRGCAWWQGACMVAGGGMHGRRGACMVAGGHAWWCSEGACMVAGGACVGYDEIRSMSGQYASRWNAFLSYFNFR